MYEQLAKKHHRARGDVYFPKCFWWRREWYVMTGYFGKHRTLGTVAQYRSATTNQVAWNDPTGEFVGTNEAITAQWTEPVKDVTNKPWGVKRNG